MSSTTSWGATLPPAAWPKVRINVDVSMMVRMTTSVTPKLLASSDRVDESNNIKSLYLLLVIMDFKIQTAEQGGLAGAGADALVVVLGGEALPAGLDAVVARHAQAAIKLGDFALKGGQALTLTQAEGV